jgi:predicted O-linked N-acetylglucosamine transferase (SPINDLY family)
MPTTRDRKLKQAAAALAAGDHAGAEQLCRKVLRSTPRDSMALHIAAHARRGQGDAAGARDLLRRALEIDPLNLQAMEELGAAELEAGDFRQAEAWLQRAIAHGRRRAAVFCWLGISLSAQGRPAEALGAFRRAVAAEPRDAEMHINLGHELLKAGSREEAIASYERALAIEPGNAGACVSRGDALLELGRLEEALASYDRALALEPAHANALHNRGIALLDLGHYEAAATAFQRLLETAPDYPYAPGYRLHALLHCCDWKEYEKAVAQVVESTRAGKPAAGPFNFLPISDSAPDHFRCARQFVEHEFPAAARPLWQGERYDHRKIRVAYLSADFRNHATAYLVAGVFETHDRTRFELSALSFSRQRSDEMTRRLEPCFDRFVDVGQRSDREVALLLRELEIDIAVDLHGFTRGGRAAIFAQRPAPVQVNYLGYPGTMGAQYMDYIIGDRWVIPEEHQRWYAEKIVYMPDSYQANDTRRRMADRAPSRAEAGLPEAGFVFCCFNSSYKLSPGLLGIWMRLLQQRNGSVLWLVEDNPAAARNLRREAEQRGVDAGRLIFAPRLKLEDHLARHRLADLFLDTHPCNAHTTASDALWAGLPLLTRLGDTFAGRVAASLLAAVGLPELIARSWEEYEHLALELSADSARLAALKARLAAGRATQPLFDTGRYCRHLETAYVGMWKRTQLGAPPENFAVGER